MWPEVEKAKLEKRHELVLGGKEVARRLQEDGLDPAIFDLTSLNYLDLHDVGLRSIPDDIVKLPQLQTLVLHSNKLEELNDYISKLVKLKLLDVSGNHLHKISSIINDLVNVVTLNFNFNSIQEFPPLTGTQKLTVLNLSKNKLKAFPDVFSEKLLNLSELKLSDNEIEIVPAEVNQLPALKVLELQQNKIKTLPGELADCTKLKVLELKQNPIGDRRLLKLIDQCRTKQVIDYVKAHSPRAKIELSALKNEVKKIEEQENDETNAKYVIKVHYAKDNLKIIINDNIKSVREFFAACIVNHLSFTEEKLKKFIQIQNKLHDTVCSKRTSSTIATHDLGKLPPGDLEYTTRLPNELIIKPLNRTTPMSGLELFTKLQNEADNLRKEKKRNTYSGIHKYLYLIEGKPVYPCLVASTGDVISFPPLTNSEISKIDLNTKNMIIEVTSSVSLHLCKIALDAILKELVTLLDQLDVTQVKTTDKEGNLKGVYPSKSDLKFVGSDIFVVRD